MRRVKVKDLFGEQRTFQARVVVAAAFAVLLVGLVAARLFWLQVVRHDYYADLSQGNRVRIEPLPPDRGIIYDREGRVLAENTPAYQLTVTREQVPNLDGTLGRLVELDLLEEDDLPRVRQLLASRKLFEAVPVRLRLEEHEIGRYAVHRHELPGVDLATRMARYYPFGTVGVHALGYHVASVSREERLG